MGLKIYCINLKCWKYLVKNMGPKIFHIHKNMLCYKTCCVKIKFCYSTNGYKKFSKSLKYTTLKMSHSQKWWSKNFSTCQKTLCYQICYIKIFLPWKNDCFIKHAAIKYPCLWICHVKWDFFTVKIVVNYFSVTFFLSTKTS